MIAKVAHSILSEIKIGYKNLRDIYGDNGI